MRHVCVRGFNKSAKALILGLRNMHDNFLHSGVHYNRLLPHEFLAHESTDQDTKIRLLPISFHPVWCTRLILVVPIEFVSVPSYE